MYAFVLKVSWLLVHYKAVMLQRVTVEQGNSAPRDCKLK